MSVVAPWHSSKDSKVYHDNDECTEGNNIETKYRLPGKGNRKLCKKCEELKRIEQQAKNYVKSLDEKGFFDKFK